ncbi:hypothetical protein [Pelagibius sp.]|uniref:hypothetical protein n=1 Tax=Pelagibius sp. TaxID=1931238 RepID=UPI003B5112A3
MTPTTSQAGSEASRGRAGRTLAAAAAGVFAAALIPAGQQGIAAERCSAEVRDHLGELPLAEGDVKSLRIMERVNIADDFGPDIFGVDAWVRLHSCSGYLVLNMSRGCFLRQAYTRGDCQVEGLPNY